MAKPIVINHDGCVIELPLQKIDRSKLIGREERLICDEQGEPCIPASVSLDGRCLVRSGGLSGGYLDGAGNSISRSTLVTIDADGDQLDELPSTLGDECEVYGPIEPGRILEHVCTAAYQLDDRGLSDDLRQALAEGAIFEAEFRYRPSVTTNPIFILANEQGCFGLVCKPRDIVLVDLDHGVDDQAADDEDDWDDDWDDD